MIGNTIDDYLDRYEYKHPNQDCSEVAEDLKEEIGGGIVTFSDRRSTDLIMTLYPIRIPINTGNEFRRVSYHTVLVHKGFVCEPLMVHGMRRIELRTYIRALCELNGRTLNSSSKNINKIIKEVFENGEH